MCRRLNMAHIFKKTRPNGRGFQAQPVGCAKGANGTFRMGGKLDFFGKGPVILPIFKHSELVVSRPMGYGLPRWHRRIDDPPVPRFHRQCELTIAVASWRKFTTPSG
ncbi:hypothetical protein GGD50_004209 [Rhizobium paranaense]|uniref:Uncharacterized protein n=1 Tax=Rhizobium paranaense TaxID=1650438 RepID=A0A7W8XUF0_9HYPH|nr:hypothetical protein [Rhizobium paranaense]